MSEEPSQKEKEETQAFTVRIGKDFLYDYDIELLDAGFKTRNEAIRAAMRDQRSRWRREGKVKHLTARVKEERP